MRTIGDQSASVAGPNKCPNTVCWKDLVQSRARCLALERENATLRAALAELERVAQRDTLTPLYNRRHFLSAINKKLSGLAVGEIAGAVVFMDVNQLKSINDQFGHAAGDQALMEIAARLQRSIGDTEIAARIGGDEFGVLIDSSRLEDAKQRVMRFSDALTTTPASHEGWLIALSACFGVAMLRGGESGVSILAEADHNMYLAKHRIAGHEKPYVNIVC